MEEDWSNVRHNKPVTLSNIVETYNHLRHAIDSTLPSLPPIISSKPSPLPPLQIVITGAVKSGKSTLVNALLGTEVLPSSSAVCTSRITVLRKSPDNRFHIKMGDDTLLTFNTKEDLITQLEELVGGGRETAHTQVVVELVGSDLLDQGLQIVDTPGFNENSKVREDSLNFMRTAAVVLFVINRDEACLVLENAAFLRYIAAYNILPLFILNKVDADPNPKLFPTQAHKRKYREETNRTINKVKAEISNIFPNISPLIFPLSAFEALYDSCPAYPFQYFLQNLGSSLRQSLLPLITNSLSQYTAQATTLMTEFISYEHKERAISILQDLITRITQYKSTMKAKLIDEIEKEFDSFIQSNKNALQTTLGTCDIPFSQKLSWASEDAHQYLMVVLSNTVKNHLQSTATKFYKESFSFLQNISKLMDEDSFWTPLNTQQPLNSSRGNQSLTKTMSKWSMGVGLLLAIAPNSIATGTIATGITGGIIASGGTLFLLGGLGIIASALTEKDITKDKAARQEVITYMLEPKQLQSVKQSISSLFAKTYDSQFDVIHKELITIKRTQEATLSSENRQTILKQVPEITKSYVTLTAAKSMFLFDEPIIDLACLFPGNSWGVIYKATFQNKPFFAQVFDNEFNLSMKYINSLGEHYLIDLADGKRALLRESLWGHFEDTMPIEGYQGVLNKWLINHPPVDERMLRDSLVLAFISHGLSEQQSETEVKRILRTATEFVKYQIDLNALAMEHCIDGKLPTELECISVTAYTMESNLYQFINADLRSTQRDQQSLKNWAPYLYLLLSALNHMKPVTSGSVYRGLNHLISNYHQKLSPERPGMYWYTITSASKRKDVAIRFARKESTSGMIFEISLCKAYSVSWLSILGGENELLLVPGSCFQTVNIDSQENLVVVEMKQIASDLSFL